MKNTKKEALAEFHRSNILKAAEKLFFENGIDDTTIDSIAKEAGYSKATLYVYFKNKDDIVNASYLNGMQLFYDTIADAVRNISDFIAQFYSVCDAMVAFQKEYPFYFDSLLRDMNFASMENDSPKIFEEIVKVGDKIDETIIELLKLGVKQGYVREDIRLQETEYMLWASISGVIYMAKHKERYFSTCIKVTKDDFIRYSFDLLLQSIQK
ncbi:TetR/AcrR family transcriptional regulator [Lachnospiraceae bacterium MD1]|uniref:TetR/AcrR family transcriptional regulator n=1 Tax=Variimorphobacter saccharofermentans TaxID=2755051 RepID=A0A839K4P8_9FIRM|nr:TetR/AcrR family transcriptional regulator [Variimorphobacter saccharofermentans]MBB2184338.1 TetR/AcrR family transcriptional regulator [Variimorphobacter saccharofermentans]